jgi:hypothetical protein
VKLLLVLYFFVRLLLVPVLSPVVQFVPYSSAPASTTF